MSYFLKIDPQVIRNKICDYLASDPELMEGMKASEIIYFESNLPLEPSLPELLSRSLNLYILRMRSPTSWGGAIEINCATKIFNYNFEVINIRSHPHTTIKFEHNGNTNIGKMTWSGGHYEPVRT
jgi:hypothetical protein